MPELRLVVLALQDRLAYGPTFEAALASLFGGEASSLSSGDSAHAGTTTQPAAASQTASQNAPQAAANMDTLIAEAGKDFSDYQRLTAEGKLGEAGQKLDELKHVLDQLNQHKK
jgi:uncharacterized membrane protein (UPF0182 family)